MKRSLLVIGFDGAELTTLKPAMQAGLLPNFSRLFSDRTIQTLQTETGLPVNDRWKSAIGKSTNTLKQKKKASQKNTIKGYNGTPPSLWESLHKARLNYISIGLPSILRHPAENKDNIYIDDTHWNFDHTGYNKGKYQNIRDQALLSQKEIDKWCIHPDTIDPEIIRSLIPKMSELTDKVDSRLSTATKALAKTLSINNAATALLKKRKFNLQFINFPLLHELGSSFMPFHPPAHSSVDSEEKKTYENVMTSALQMSDALLGQLADAVEPGTPILFLSMHGWRRSAMPPNWTIPTERAFSSKGVIALGGEGQQAQLQNLVSIQTQDIRSSILNYFGIHTPDGKGKSCIIPLPKNKLFNSSSPNNGEHKTYNSYQLLLTQKNEQIYSHSETQLPKKKSKYYLNNLFNEFKTLANQGNFEQAKSSIDAICSESPTELLFQFERISLLFVNNRIHEASKHAMTFLKNLDSGINEVAQQFLQDWSANSVESRKAIAQAIIYIDSNKIDKLISLLECDLLADSDTDTQRLRAHCYSIIGDWPMVDLISRVILHQNPNDNLAIDMLYKSFDILEERACLLK